MNYRLICADVLDGLRSLPDDSVQCVVTSPPYWGLRDYGVEGQMGLESTPDEYARSMVAAFAEVRRVLRKGGTLWLNIGDSYAGSWGAQSRENPGPQGTSTLGCGSPQIKAHPQETQTGSLKNTPGCKAKDLVGIPWMLAFALRADGWYLRSEIIWAKPNPMPESVTDRPTKAHEYLFLLTKSARYYYDADAIKEPASESSIERWAQDVEAQDGSSRAAGGAKINGPMKAVGGPRRSDKQRGHGRRHAGFNDRWDAMEKGEQCGGTRNKRSVWTIGTEAFRDAHFAVMPTALVEPCILAGSKVGDVILDPFAGSGTTGVVALELKRNFIGVELNPAYVEMSRRRLQSVAPLLAKELTA